MPLWMYVSGFLITLIVVATVIVIKDETEVVIKDFSSLWALFLCAVWPIAWSLFMIDVLFTMLVMAIKYLVERFK